MRVKLASDKTAVKHAQKKFRNVKANSCHDRVRVYVKSEYPWIKRISTTGTRHGSNTKNNKFLQNIAKSRGV